jgi:hypothetical protein
MTEPRVRIALFLNQSRKVPPWTASEKFEIESGQGKAYGLWRY